MRTIKVAFDTANQVFSNLGGAGPYNPYWGTLYWYRGYTRYDVIPGASSTDCDGASFTTTSTPPIVWMDESYCYLTLSDSGSADVDGSVMGSVIGELPLTPHGCTLSDGSTPTAIPSVNRCVSMVPSVIAYPTQPDIMRFANVGALNSVRIDYIIEDANPGSYIQQFDAHPNDVTYVRKGLKNNVALAGGIVALNVPAPGALNVTVKIQASCCSRPTCRSCMLNISADTCRYWEEGAAGCDPGCLPKNPITHTINAYCCCFGVDTFPLEHMGMCKDNFAPMFSPRTDGGFRHRYLAIRNIVGLADTTQYSCDSSHVRPANRWTQFAKHVFETTDLCNYRTGTGAQQANYAKLPPAVQTFCESSILAAMVQKIPIVIQSLPIIDPGTNHGDPVADWQSLEFADFYPTVAGGHIPYGLTARNRFFDFDRGGGSLRFLEEVTITSKDFNILYWKYPDSYQTCVDNYDTVNEIRTSSRATLADLAPNKACCSDNNRVDYGDFGTQDIIARSGHAPDGNTAYDSSDGLVTYSDGQTPPNVQSASTWFPSDQIVAYSGFIKTDPCCGCTNNNCGTGLSNLPCCARYITGGQSASFCTERCDLYDQYDTATDVPFIDGFLGAVGVKGRHPTQLIDLPEHSTESRPPSGVVGNWEMLFRANTMGGNENNPLSSEDPDTISAPYGANDNMIIDFETGLPVTNPSWTISPGKCQAAVRMIDVYYAVAVATSAGVDISFKNSVCETVSGTEQTQSPPVRKSCPPGSGAATNGRNVLFTSDSTAPVCFPTDCTGRQTCKYHTDCPANDGHPRFCARKCISEDCPAVGPNWDQLLGTEFGICQDCWDCVYNDELFDDPGLSALDNICSRVCAVISQPEAAGFAPYGLCPDCNQLSTLMTAYYNDDVANNIYLPVPDSQNPAYKRCAASSECDSGLYCSVACDAGYSSLAEKPGVTRTCNPNLGTARSAGGWGWCQPCATGCPSELGIRDNYDNSGVMAGFDGSGNLPNSCPDVCGTSCPRCLLDQLCKDQSPPTFAQRGYDITDPTIDFFRVGPGGVSGSPWGSGAASTPVDHLGYHTPDKGPFPLSGCWREDSSVRAALSTEVASFYQLPVDINAATVQCGCLTSYPAGLPIGSLGGPRLTITGSQYDYPANYGLNSCQAHDISPPLPPLCDQSAAPAWCSQSWCYVDKNNCNVPYASSSYAPGFELIYSYSACS